MNHTKIKICGLKSREDILVANEIMPDYVGFVFALKKREVTNEQAFALRELLDPKIPAVGVFLNDDYRRIIDLLKRGVIDIAQLHGSETPEDIMRIKMATDKPVIKAIPVKNRQEVEAYFDSPADFVLYDGGTGSGVRCDWSLLHDIPRPFFLAGGLHPGNISQAIQMVHPYAIDLSSGVEIGPSIYQKDPDKMRAAVKAVRSMI